MEKKWYILFIKTGDEDKMKRKLRYEGLNSFVPKMKVVHRKAGESTLIVKPMFPGYLFIESEMNQTELIQKLREIQERMPKFMKLLKVDKEGTSVLYPQEQAYLKSLLNEEMVMDHSIGIIEGDRTMIIEGPLMGMESKIIKIDRHKRRAVIEVMICNVPTQVNVSLEIISKTA